MITTQAKQAAPSLYLEAYQGTLQALKLVDGNDHIVTDAIAHRVIEISREGILDPRVITARIVREFAASVEEGSD